VKALRGGGRSLSITPQALTLLLAVALIHSVWRGSGARVALVAEVAIVVLLLTDLVWSILATRWVDVVVVDLPTDATVGDALGVELIVRGSRGVLEVRMLTFGRSAWHRVEPPERGALTALAPSRLITSAAVFELRSSAPLGLVGLTRRVVVDLPHAVHIGPRPEAIEGIRLPDRGAVQSTDEIVRGTRPWVPGDPLRSVHWPSVARTGVLTVRELEPPPTPRLVVSADLGDGGPPGESVAGRAAWLAREGLRRGLAVELVTVERDGPRSARVRNAIDVGRRLAGATRGTPVLPTIAPGTATVVSLTVEGDRWE
jgi:uncharacterized protein (DUF58 family)